MIELDGRTLAIDALGRLARRPHTVQVRLADAARPAIEHSAAVRRRLVAGGAAVYGVTTGFGDSATGQISADLAEALQHNLIRYHLNGVGDATPVEVVRAMVAIRANCLARGVSGVRIELIEALLALLRHDIMPVIPQRGSVGASGDLVPSCYLANVLVGDGQVWHGGGVRPTTEAFAECALTPLRLEAKEGLALINGTSFMAAFAALALVDAAELAETADLCTALAVQALTGYARHFDGFLTRHKPYHGLVRSASRIAEMLVGSGLTRQPDDLRPLAPQQFRRLDRQVQDRYSVRCAPHVIGVLYDTIAWAREWVTTEINSANDNPLFDAAAEAWHSGGNFYGGHVAQAMDALKIAAAGVADLLDRQLALIVDEKFNNGLPNNLAAPTATRGLHHGYKGMQIACSAFAAEALKLSAPASVFSRSTEAHNQDKVSMGAIAAREARAVVELAEQVAAVHLHAMAQAVDLRGSDRLSPSTRRAHMAIRQHIRFLEKDRRMDEDIHRLVELARSGELRQAANQQEPGYDAIVIGGGPGGAAAGLVLAQAGQRILLLERQHFPRFHIGESMLPYSCALLERLGLAQAVAEIGFPIKRGAEFTEADGSHRRVDFTAQGSGRTSDTYQVERADFDDILLSQAATHGAEVVQGAKVTEVLTDAAGRVAGVAYQLAGKHLEAQAPYVLDASGRAGVIAHQHLRGRVVSERLKMVALYRHFNDVDEATNPGVTGDIQIGSHAHGWVWAIPIRPDKLSIGVVTQPSQLNRRNREKLFRDHVNRIPRIAQRLRGATALGELRGESDFCYHTETLAGPGFFVVGDAGCFVDPIFSGGIYLSLMTGWKAAETVIELLTDRVSEKDAVESYSRFYKTGYDCYFRLIYAFYESGFKLGPYLKSTGVQVSPCWPSRLLAGDFWSRKNPLARHLRSVDRFATFAPFEPLYGCPVYPLLDAEEPDETALDDEVLGAEALDRVGPA